MKKMEKVHDGYSVLFSILHMRANFIGIERIIRMLFFACMVHLTSFMIEFTFRVQNGKD